MLIDTVRDQIQGPEFKLSSLAAHFAVRPRERAGEGLRCLGLPIIRQRRSGKIGLGRTSFWSSGAAAARSWWPY
ncbi:hypothetical protein [Sphingobium sp. CECT 9361]|uniref:hypothetical protein n=1 Tax=Sphingobium sp. CECT 9361 TaxID=2845384 RepID=UPI001E6219BD|nr:hypothetical protein [Sphingobium sp. CECT 9361]